MATLTATTLSLVQVAAPQLLLVATALLAAMVARAAPAAPSATRRAPLAADAQAQRQARPATRSHPVVTRVAHRLQAQALAQVVALHHRLVADAVALRSEAAVVQAPPA